MRIATESSYHRPRDEKKENEQVAEGMDRVFGKPWYEEEDPELAKKKRKERGI